MAINRDNPSSTLNLAEVTEHIEWLYGDADPLINIVSYGDWEGETHEPFMLADIEDYVTRMDARRVQGIYLRVTSLAEAPARGKRGTADAAHRLTALWSDIDIAGVGHADKSGKLPPDEAAAKKIIEVSSLPEPSRWIHSGGGMYPIWKITDGLITAANYAEITQLSKDLHAEISRAAESLGWTVAPMGDLSRVLRLPGTINRKEGGERPCKVVEKSDVSYTVAALREALPPTGLPEKVALANPSDVWESLPDDGKICRAIQRKLDLWGARLEDAPAGSRHRVAQSGILSLITVGNFGHSGAREAIGQLEKVFDECKPEDQQGASEFESMVNWALAKTEVREDRQCCGGWAFTESHMSERVAEEIILNEFRWSSALGWVRWTGNVWARIDDQIVIQEVKGWVLDGFRPANKAYGENPKDSQLEAIMKGWKSMLSRDRLANITKLTQGIEGVWFDAIDMDADPDILNCRNGVVDLRTGRLLDPDPERLVSKITGCDYDPNATHPDFDAAMTAAPDDIRTWLQTRIGQSATGYYTPDDLFVLLHGGGANGKSTILNGIEMALGSYHAIVNDRVLLGTAQRDETMDLLGARSAWMEELPEGAHLDVIKLKKLVGTKKIKGHHLYKSEMEWNASHSLFATSNYRPVVDETDDGTWRRLALVVFPYRYVEEPTLEHERKGDPQLRRRVESDQAVHRAFLRWVIEGARTWYEGGEIMPNLPKTVRDDTDEWRREVDLIMAFWGDEHLTPAMNYAIASEDLLGMFTEAVEGQKHHAWGMKTFAARFAGHDATKRARVVKRRIRVGGNIRISEPDGRKRLKAGEMITAWIGVKFSNDLNPLEDGLDSAPLFE